MDINFILPEKKELLTMIYAYPEIQPDQLENEPDLYEVPINVVHIAKRLAYPKKPSSN